MSSSIQCSICWENYKNDDALSTTTCGHIFHDSCLQQWKQRSPLCADCRQQFQGFHRVFINFEGSTEINELKVQLEEQRAVLEANEARLLHAEEHLNISDGNILSLLTLTEERDSEEREGLKEMEINVIQSHDILIQKEEIIRDLELKIELLTVQNTSRDTVEQEMDRHIEFFQSKLEESERNVISLNEELFDLKLQIECNIEEINGINDAKEKLYEKLLEHNTEKTNILREQHENERKIIRLQEELLVSKDLIRNFELEADLKSTAPAEAKNVHKSLEILTKTQEENSSIELLRRNCTNCLSHTQAQHNQNKGALNREITPLMEKYTVLEEKWKQVALELENEKFNSTKLLVDNVNLEKHLNCRSSESGHLLSNLSTKVRECSENSEQQQQQISQEPTVKLKLPIANDSCSALSSETFPEQEEKPCSSSNILRNET